MIVYGMVSPMKNWQISPLKLCAVIGAGLLLSACSTLQSDQPEIIPDNELSTDSSTTYPVPSYDGSLESSTTSTSATPGNYYVVQRGDTIYAVASRYGRNYKDIASWNRLKAPYTLKQGQRLLIASPNTDSYANTRTPVTPTGTNYSSVNNNTQAGGYHTAQSGDTVYNIARRYQLSPQNLIAINALAPPYHLSVGQVIRLGSNVPMAANNTYTLAPVASTNSVKPQSAMNGKQHVVRAGETLYSISRRYGYTPEEVAAWNRLPVPYTIGVGQVLLIAQPHAATTKTTKKIAPKAHKKSQVLTKSSKHVTQVVPEPVTEPTPAKTVKPATKTASKGMITPSGSGRAVASFHTVQTGETLDSIAASYHITTHDLAIWNGIGKPYTVMPGKKLLIVPP